MESLYCSQLSYIDYTSANAKTFSVFPFCIPDPMSIFLASMACSRLLLGNHDRLLMQMIEHGRPLMALATMMYSDITITEVCMYVRMYVGGAI